jgi:hypothetical protein
VRTVAARLVLACLCASVLACDNSLEPVSCVGGESLVVTVNTAPTGLPPRFSWSPPCLVGEVSIESGGLTGNTWDLFADSNRIASPVTYGLIASGAQLVSTPQPLVRGTRYTISVWRWVSGTPNGGLYWRAGVASFVP